jgi:flagellar basal-body rod protein FlgC
MTASAFEIAASGMAAHRAEMDLIAQNIANADLTAASGRPFRPHAAVVAPSDDPTFADALGSALSVATSSTFGMSEADDPVGEGWAGDAFAAAFGGGYAPQPVRVAGVIDEPSTGPEARGEAGIDSISEMVSLVSAGRAYDADVASLQAAKQMDAEAIDVDRS